MSGSDPREAATVYRRGLSFIDEAFERAREAGDCVVPCKRGCASCCSAVFDLPPADGLLLLSWLSEQEPSLREDIEARSGRILDSVRSAASRLLEEGEDSLAGWEPQVHGLTGIPARVATVLAGLVREPCPILGPEGECRAHDSRPALCRLGGLPWRDPVSGAELPDFCRLEPEMGDNPAQELDLSRLDGLREDCVEALRHESRGAGELPRRSFIAAVLAPRAGA